MGEKQTFAGHAVEVGRFQFGFARDRGIGPRPVVSDQDKNVRAQYLCFGANNFDSIAKQEQTKQADCYLFHITPVIGIGQSESNITNANQYCIGVNKSNFALFN